MYPTVRESERWNDCTVWFSAAGVAGMGKVHATKATKVKLERRPMELRPVDSGAIQPVAEVAEPWQNVFLGVERAIERRSVNDRAGMMLLHFCDALGRADDAEQPDAAGLWVPEENI